MATLTPLAKVSIIVSWVAVGLACATTAIQITWLCRYRKNPPRVADYCVWLALLIGIVLVAQTTWAMLEEGSARYQWDISQQNLAAIAKSLLINELLWSICGALIRVYSCCLLHTLFGVFSTIKWSIRVLLCFCIAHGMASTLELVLICRPMAAQWDPNVKGLCGSQIASFIALETSGLLLDVAILVVPVYPMKCMLIKMRSKMYGIVSLDVGVLVLIVTALRLKALHLAVSTDYTYSKSYLGLLSSVGSMLSVILCNIISFPAMVRTAAQRYRARTTRKERASGFEVHTSDGASDIVHNDMSITPHAMMPQTPEHDGRAQSTQAAVSLDQPKEFGLTIVTTAAETCHESDLNIDEDGNNDEA